MIAVLFAELRKLRRPTLALPTLLAASGLTALTTSLLYLLIDSPNGNGREGMKVDAIRLSKPDGLVFGFQSAATLLGVIALCVLAAQTAQEYTYGTLRNILVRQPSRMKVLAGKYVAMTLFAVLIVLVSAAVSFAISYALAGGAHVTTAAWTSSTGWHATTNALVNVTIATIGFGTLGMILGLLLRSPISSIAVGVIWILIVENLLTAVVSGIDQWLPGQLLTAVSTGGSISFNGTPAITYRYAMAGSAIYVVVGAVIVSVLFKRRDVAN
jgi:ABC-type transport system involved in multi-copper enzyme maturation permease subunit